MSKPWKALEKEAAERFGGVRNVRVSYSESIPDVSHPRLAIECKWGLQIPKYLIVENPTCYQVEDQVYVVCPVNDLTREGLRRLVVLDRHRLDFLTDGLRQAESYVDNRGKYPVLCLKPPRYRSFLVAFRL